MGELLSAAGVVDRTGVGGRWGRADLERAEYYRGTRSATVSRSSRTSMEGRRQEFAALSVMVPSFFAALVSHVDDVVAGKAVATRHFSPTATGLVWGQKTLSSNLTPSLSQPSFPVSFIYRSGENGGISELSVDSLPPVQLRL